MRLFAHRATKTTTPSAAPVEVADEDLGAEIERLSERARWSDEVEDQRELLRLRNRLGIVRLHEASDCASFADPAGTSLPMSDGLPEFTREQLTPGLVRAGILRDGCVLVRGLIDHDRASSFARDIDRSFAECDRLWAGETHDPRLFEEFTPDARQGDVLPRGWIRQGGGVLAADSPLLSMQLVTLLRETGLVELVEGYLGESPLITSQKTTLRKADPAVPGGWHQDGKFMGPVRALNVWLALSRCGDVAPGLDIVPRRLNELVTTATEEAPLDYVASQRVAEAAAGDTPIQRPIFDPGDALLFDELFLHKTGSDPTMPEPRYAIENWFFGGSAFPQQYSPIAV
jgi:hypothetical protein